MNRVWTTLMIISVTCLIFISPGIVHETIISSAQGALSLCMSLCAIYAVWLGLFEIISISGLSEKLARCFKPIIKKVFRTNNPYAQEQISLNIAANLLGLGSAATPAGIEAMRAMDDGSEKPTFGMIMLFVINATSIQLLPTTVMSLRTNHGSMNSSDIILPTLISTICSTLLAIFAVILIDRIKSKRRH